MKEIIWGPYNAYTCLLYTSFCWVTLVCMGRAAILMLKHEFALFEFVHTYENKLLFSHWSVSYTHLDVYKRQVYGYYYPTSKNGMVKEFYGLQGFEKISGTEGNTVWMFEITKDYENKNKYIKIKENE